MRLDCRGVCAERVRLAPCLGVSSVLDLTWHLRCLQVFEYADEVAAKFKEQLKSIEESRYAAD